MLKSFFTFLIAATFAGAATITLSSNNFVSLVGPVTASSVNDAIKSFSSKGVIDYMEDNKKINLYINSPGGSVFAGNHLVQYIKTLQDSNIEVNCIAQNFMSMGFVIMQSCTNRYVMFDSVGMQHQMSLGLRGNIENIRTHFSLLDRINNIIIDMEITKIKMDRELYLKKILSDWWLFGEESVRDGVADKLVTVKCVPTIIYEKVKRTDTIFNIDFTIELNKCPILMDIKLIDLDSKHSINITKLFKYYDFVNYPFNVKEIVEKFRLT
jgi:ATP-dependent Clp protease protease subunit